VLDPQTPAFVAVSLQGRRLAERLSGRLIDGSPAEALALAWRSSRQIVFFGAAGIAVRLLAPLLKDKASDPAVVVVDDAGRHAISLLSGHEGGANELARNVARQLGAEPVLTTASEVLSDRNLLLGIGCSRGASAAEIEDLAREALRTAHAGFESVVEIGTIEAKADELGLLEFAARWHVPLRCFSAGELAGVTVPNPSSTVQAAVGTPSVAEAAALLAGAELLVPKMTSSTVTVAVGRRPRHGSLSVVGLGPGGRQQLTFEAWEALRAADTVIGYGLYTDLVCEWLPLADCQPFPIGQELERTRRAIDLAAAGQRVALVSSGDAGIYALAGLVYEQLSHEATLDVEVIPGITAAISAAALLGAPLMADFAAISLSDLQVSAELIRDRLHAAAKADLVVVLYNPASGQRRELLAAARDILLAHRRPETPVGLVRNAYRTDQSMRLTTLAEVPLDNVDMLTTVIVGSSQTYIQAGRMITRRQAVS